MLVDVNYSPNMPVDEYREWLRAKILEVNGQLSVNDLLIAELGEPEKCGRWWCPLCQRGDNNRAPALTVNKNNNYWHCYGCGAGGGAVEWKVWSKNLSYWKAIKSLDGGMNNGKVKPQNLVSNAVSRLLPDELQDTWREVVVTCEKNLWADMGTRARVYLHKRGLKDETLQSPFWRVGYSPGMKIGDLRVERGIVLPCFTTTPELDIEYIQYIKIRRPDDRPKYKKLPGNGCDLAGLYGAECIEGADIIFMAEGEFDCLLLNQEACDLIGCATLGSASDKFNFGRFGKWVIGKKHIIAVYDTDNAGATGADYWCGLSKRVQSVKVPTGKDITEYYLSGGNLSDWVIEVVCRLELDRD